MIRPSPADNRQVAQIFLQRRQSPVRFQAPRLGSESGGKQFKMVPVEAHDKDHMALTGPMALYRLSFVVFTDLWRCLDPPGRSNFLIYSSPPAMKTDSAVLVT